MLRTVCGRPTLWEALLPAEALVMPAELEAVDRLLDDARYFEPFRRWFDPEVGRPSIPIETYLRLMFLKYRYRLGYETLCAEVSDSLSWLRFCRIPIGESAPHPSTLMKITTRCGPALIEELNAELVGAAVEAGVVDFGWLRADTTVVTADLADLAETTLEQARRVLTNAPRAADRPVRRLRQMLADLEHLIGALAQIIIQTRQRLAGQTPSGKTRRVSLVDDDARPIRKGSLATPTQFGYTAQVTDNRQGIVIDYEIQAGMPPDAPRLVPAIERAIAAVGAVPDSVTADRGYGESSVENDLEQLGVSLVAILRKGKTSPNRQATEAGEEFIELVKWRTGSEGRIAALKRQHGWARTRIRGLAGARTWCGWGVLCHNTIKIAALTR